MRIEINKIQEKFLLDSELHNNSSNNISFSLVFHGKLDIDMFHQAFNYVTNKVDSFRCTFVKDADGLSYMTDECSLEEVPFIVDNAGSIELAEQQIKVEVKKPFHLYGKRPVRAFIYLLPSDYFIINLNFHHIAFDGVCGEDALQLYSSCYNSLCDTGVLPELKLPTMLSFNEYLSEKYSKARDRGGLTYWSEQLKDFPSQVDFVTPQTLTSGIDGIEEFELGTDLVSAIRGYARERRETPFLVLFAAWLAVQSRLSESKKVLSSYSVNLRHPKFHNLIGGFVNNLPIPAEIKADTTFAELTSHVTQFRSKSKQFQEMPLQDIVTELRRDGMLSSNDTYMNTAINFANWQDGSDMDLAGAEFIESYREQMDFMFDLALDVDPGDNGDSRICYKGKFNRTFIHSLCRSFITILWQGITNPVMRIVDIDLSSENEFEGERISLEISQRLASEPTVLKTMTNLVQRFGQTPKLFVGERPSSWYELDKDSNRIANGLTDYYQKTLGMSNLKGAAIGVRIPRSINFISILWGIWKVGGIYVPIDIYAPEGRVKFIEEDCKIKIVLGEKEIRSFSICSDKFEYDADLQCMNNIAYVVYTSGTTGKPKGVPISFLNFECFYINGIKALKATEESRQTQIAKYCFDAFFFECFPTLMAGGTVFFASEDVCADTISFADYIRCHSMTSVTFSPAFLSIFKEKLPKTVKQVTVGGEMTSPEVINKWSASYRFLNVYGPTESTVFSSYKELTDKEEPTNIGAPNDGVFYHIMDSDGRILPRGTVGIVYMGGLQLTKGYIGREHLNETLFIKNKYAPTDWIVPGVNDILYNSGDLGYLNDDGECILLGRVDHQIKIRGYRIELSEVESQISHIPTVENSFVKVVTVAGNKHLAAYVQTQNELLDADAVREQLAQQLPNYMVPSFYMFLKRFPVNSSDKIDAKALPEITITPHHSEPPRSSREKIIFDVVAKLLDGEDFGVTDDLFDVGMTSLSIIAMQNELVKRGINIPVSTIYKEHTIRAIAKKECDDIANWYSMVADGRPVMAVIAGLGGVDKPFMDMLERFADSYDIILFNSFIDNARMHAFPCLSEFVRKYSIALESLLRGTPLSCIVGHSLGGKMAYTLAAEYASIHSDCPNVYLLDTYITTSEQYKEIMNDEINILEQGHQQKDMVSLMKDERKVISYFDDVILSDNYPGHVTLYCAQNIPESILPNKMKLHTTDRTIVNINEQIAENIKNWRILVPQLKVMEVDADHFSLIDQVVIQ